MTISRGQMNRQLYMGGGIMNAVPREQYGLGSVFKGVTKAVKKVAGGVKDIVSSDLGKAALLAAGGYYLGGGSLLGAQRAGMSGFSFANLPGAGMVPEVLKGKSGVGLGIAALGGLFGGAMAGKSEEEVEALTRDVPALKSYLTQYYTNLNPELRNQPEKVEEFVNSQITEYNEGRGGYAMGGRIGYQQGSMIGINTDKLKEDASGILDILGKNTPFGIAKMMVEKTQGNEAQIGNFIKKLLKSTPPGLVINFIADRYKIPESIASRMVANQMADANMSTDASGSADEGFPSRPEFKSSAEDTSVMPIKNRRLDMDVIKDRFENRFENRFEGGEPIQPLNRFEGGEPIQPLNRFTQEEIEDMVDRLRKMDPSDMPSIPLPEGIIEDDGLYDNEKKYYPDNYDSEPRFLNQGGRIGYAYAGPVLPNDPTQPVNPFAPKPTGPVLPDRMASNMENDKILEALFEKYLDMGLSPEKAAEKAREEFERMSMMKTEGRGLAALGGRMGYAGGSDDEVDLQEMLNAEPPFDASDYIGRAADYKKSPLAIPDNILKKLIEYFRRNKADGGIMNRAGYALGDTASQNAMQAASIEGLPMRQNPKGVQELDLRDNGGFIPPVGIKEKEDDIPAMLSNNEFVFTADAVRGMGDGDVELGAQRMYDQMKTLEEGGRV